MTMFLFLGDMLVMLFMVSLVVWFINRDDDDNIDYAARIPLDDEDYHG